VSQHTNIENRFRKLVAHSPCPFAKDAKIMYALDWDPGIGFTENIHKTLPRFISFVTNGISDGYELFVMEIRHESIINQIEDFAGFLNKLLHEIHLSDTTSVTYFTEGIESMDWDFTFNSIRFFIPTFAPFYERNHPRYSFNTDTAFIMFQPDSTFNKYSINSKNPDRNELTEKIKTLFLENDFIYSLKYVKGSIKSIRYVKPVNLEGPPVKWWLNKQYFE